MDSTLSNPFLVNLTSKLNIVKQIGHTDLENLPFFVVINKIYIDILNALQIKH